MLAPDDYEFAKPNIANRHQVGGTHYVNKKVQPWDAMEAWMTKEQFVGFLLGSAIAYLGRFNAEAPGKGGIEDIQKARHYLDKLLEVINGKI